MVKQHSTALKRSGIGLLLGIIAISIGCSTILGKSGDSYAPEVDTAYTAMPEDLGFEEIVFVKRKPYSSDHYYTDINNGTSPDRFIRENGIFVYNLRTQQERAVVTAAQMPGERGFIGKITLSFDAKKVVFDFRESPQHGFRIWEVGLDGSGLRQLTFPAEDEAEKVARWGKPWHTDDVHPAYLPDGGIIFSSTRCEHTILCGGSAALVAPTLHRMDADGRNIQQLSWSPVTELAPVILDDGRVMYHRWEYIDKGARVSKTIWSMNPDGSKAQELFGASEDTTTVYMYPQPVPGNNQKVFCVGTCHFPQGGCVGAIMHIDLGKGIRRRGLDPQLASYVQYDDNYAISNVTPHTFVERRTEPGWHFKKQDGSYVHDKEGTSGHLYTHPYPISETEVLVSYKMKPSDHYQNIPNAYGIYLLNTAGKHRELYKDDRLSAWHPTPVLARSLPPVLEPSANRTLAAADEALCIVTNIYEGMEGVAPGEIKWIRVNEAVPRYWATGRRWPKGLSSSSWKGALWPRVQWGVVPVEADGSAYFKVPANRNIFFQALDQNFREIQRERTYVNYKPGETRSCVGCHGRTSRTTHKARAATPIALTRQPSALQAQPCDTVANGGDGRPQQVIHYPTDIQPILNANCVKCHGNEKPKAGLKLTSDLTLFYTTSYEELASKELAGPLISEFTSFSKGDQGNFNGALLPPKSLGSYQSVLIEMLSDPAHPNNKHNNHAALLDANELMVISRWADTNYQFYGAYYGRQHMDWAQASKEDTVWNPADFRRKATFEEAISDRAPAWHK